MSTQLNDNPFEDDWEFQDVNPAIVTREPKLKPVVTNEMAVVNDKQELLTLENIVNNPLQDWNKAAAQEYFNTIKSIQELISENLDKENDQMAIQGNTFDLKSGLEKIMSLTGILPKYLVLEEQYSHKNACVKVTVKCIVTTKTGVPIGVGVGSCSSFDNKEAYQWLQESEIPRWRWELRDIDGNYDKNAPEKRICDYPNDIWILKEDLETKEVKEYKWSTGEDGKKSKVETGKKHTEYKIAYNLAEYRENQHKIYRKAHIRALREAISYALNRGTQNKKIEKKKFNSFVDASELTLTCSECGASITEKVAKFSLQNHKKELCMKCQK